MRQEGQKELSEKVLAINRCSKVVKGGRKFSFSALVVVGDGQQRVGFGFAKAKEVADAMQKAIERGKKNLISFAMHKETIPHAIALRWDGARVMLKPAKEGTGIVAGSCMRAIFTLAGIKDIVAKSYGSNNPLNQVRATFAALQCLRQRRSRP